jgi:putative FmdB family regulatory protein
MPFYEYVCEECGRATELLQRISDPPATECPHCHASRLVKQVSAAGFRLKGGGWYETDFKSGGKRNLASEAEGAKTDAKSDTQSSGNDSAKSSHGCAAGACGCATTTTTTSPASPAAT